MFNGFRSPANLNNFNKPVNLGIIASGGTVTQYPANPRTNLAKNPNFESSVNGWTVSPTTGSTAISQNGTHYHLGFRSARISNGTNSQVSVSYNIKDIITSTGTYVFSAYVKAPQNGGLSYVCGYDAFGNPIWCQTPFTTVEASVSINSGQVVTFGQLVQSNFTWQRVSVAFTFSSIPTTATFSIKISNLNNSESTFLDSVLFEKTSSLLEYFDGNSADCHWNGAQNLSTSSQNTYNVHTFTSSGTFNVTSLGTTYNTVDYLIVGGGGAGAGAGGGAGGVLVGSTNIGSTAYAVSVGAGGVATSNQTRGTSGQDSSFAGLTAIGGGAGGSYDYASGNFEGLPGGSGGGSAYPYGYMDGGLGTSGQGSNGGATRGYKDGVVNDGYP